LNFIEIIKLNWIKIVEMDSNILNKIQIQWDSMGLIVNWIETRCKLVQKVLKICSWFWWFMTMVMKRHRSKETLAKSFIWSLTFRIVTRKVHTKDLHYTNFKLLIIEIPIIKKILQFSNAQKKHFTQRHMLRSYAYIYMFWNIVC